MNGRSYCFSPSELRERYIQRHTSTWIPLARWWEAPGMAAGSWLFSDRPYVQPTGITARGLCSFLRRQCYTRLLKGLSDDQVHPASMHSSLHVNQPSYPLSSWCFAPGHVLLPKAIHVFSRAALQPSAEQAAEVIRSLVK